jgi:hypothetical protein
LRLRERLRERIHLGIALHVAVNLGFALAATMGGGAVGVASAAPVIASDPSPALEGAVALYEAARTVGVAPSTASTASGRSPAVRKVPVAAKARNDGGDRFDRLALCESGGDATAVSPGGRYRGAFQFSLPTWHAAGGEDDPVDASYAEQKRVAMGWANVVEPSTQWPVCWPRTA